jgi:transposase-like protein
VAVAGRAGDRQGRGVRRGLQGEVRRLSGVPDHEDGARDHLPRKADDDCLQELRWLHDRRELAEARQDLARWLAKWEAKYPTLCDWVEENIEETLTYYQLPQQHHKHMKSTNMLERLNRGLKRRTHVVRIFPNAASCLRLIRALAVETHENWL